MTHGTTETTITSIRDQAFNSEHQLWSVYCCLIKAANKAVSCFALLVAACTSRAFLLNQSQMMQSHLSVTQQNVNVAVLQPFFHSKTFEPVCAPPTL